MSFEPDSKENEEVNNDILYDIVRWLKVVAYILADMQNLDKDDIYEDME